MREPCRSCPEKKKDYGGCRCQAFYLTGDAAAADPVCDKSPYHAKIRDAVDQAQVIATDEAPLVFRNVENSKGFG